jgi:hypothetical protein
LGPDTFETFLVYEHDRRPGVLQAVDQLLGRPPGVDRHGDGPDGDRRPEGHRPLGEVARRDRDPVAVRNSEFDQSMRERGDDPVVLLEGEALVLVDEEIPRCVHHRHVEDDPQAGGRVLPHSHLQAVDGRALGFEHLAGRGQQCVRLGDRHRGLAHGGEITW